MPSRCGKTFTRMEHQLKVPTLRYLSNSWLETSVCMFLLHRCTAVLRKLLKQVAGRYMAERFRNSETRNRSLLTPALCLLYVGFPNENATVWEFIKFVTGDRGYTIITSQIGYLPLRTGLADDPNGLKDFVEQNPLYKINLEQLSRIQPVAIWPGESATEMATAFTDAIVKSVSTDADVEQTLKQAQDQINSMMP